MMNTKIELTGLTWARQAYEAFKTANKSCGFMLEKPACKRHLREAAEWTDQMQKWLKKNQPW